jgi:hypothetical protein
MISVKLQNIKSTLKKPVKFLYINTKLTEKFKKQFCSYELPKKQNNNSKKKQL